jgi:hypothetical protein
MVQWFQERLSKVGIVVQRASQSRRVSSRCIHVPWMSKCGYDINTLFEMDARPARAEIVDWWFYVAAHFIYVFDETPHSL